MVIVGGGFAFTTLRSSIVYMLHPDNRPKFKDITVVYGARTPGMLLYRDELAEWEREMTSTCTSPWMPPMIRLEIQRGVCSYHNEAEDQECGRCRMRSCAGLPS